MSTRKPRPSALRISRLSSQGELGFDVTVKRSPRRRTLEIIVREGAVQLMLPNFVSEAEGLGFLQRKRHWVLATLDKQQRRSAEIVARQYRTGETFPFMDTALCLEVAEASRNRALRVGSMLRIELSGRGTASRSETVQALVWRWYREQALQILTEKTDALVARIGKRYAGVRLRRTKTKWGHCTTAGVIQYNWFILAAPEAVIDYLVAHEVSHLVHPNHSPAFWRLVESLCPEYRQHRAWLKSRGHTLML